MGVAGVSAEALAVILKDKRVMDWSRPTYICGQCFAQSCIVMKCRGILWESMPPYISGL